MGKRNITMLRKAYAGYKRKRTSKKNLLDVFSAFMPEIIFRTTKLEGEKIKRKTVNALF